MNRESNDENIVDSAYLNSIYLLLILMNYKKSDLKQAAISFHLLRFPNVFLKLLSEEEKKKYLFLCANSELNNLDTMLSPYLINIYNDRFHFALKELLARELVITDDSGELLVNLEQEHMKITLLEIHEVKSVNMKVRFIVRLVKNADLTDLMNKIHKVEGGYNEQ